MGLGEIALCCISFIWSNDREHPTFEKLDRVLVSMDREGHYPLTIMKALERALSNRAPLFLNTGCKEKTNKPFKFELSWLLRDAFMRKFLK